MFSTIRGWTSGSKKTLVQRYTDDLSQITTQIHELDGKLNRSQKTMDKLQSYLTYYGVAYLICVLAYLYWTTKGKWVLLAVGMIVCVLLLGLIKYSAYRTYLWFRSRQSRKLGKLRALHQKKLEKLKEETNYHATNSIIQRFSQGEDHSEDALLLMDEELKNKYKELSNLKEELAQFRQDDRLKDKKERDKWFDKVINAVAGGDSVSGMFLPIVCPKCKGQTGLYHLGNRAFKYVCPLCGWTINDVKDGHSHESEPSATLDQTKDPKKLSQ